MSVAGKGLLAMEKVRIFYKNRLEREQIPSNMAKVATNKYLQGGDIERKLVVMKKNRARYYLHSRLKSSGIDFSAKKRVVCVRTHYVHDGNKYIKELAIKHGYTIQTELFIQ